MKKTLLLLILILSFGISLTGLTQPAFAEGEQPTVIPPIHKPDYLPGPTYTEEERSDKDTYVATAQNWFVTAIARFTSTFIGTITVISLVMLILSGIQMLTAYGEEEKLTTAKKNATWAVAGLLLAIFAFAIVSIINYLPFSYPEKQESSLSTNQFLASTINKTQHNTYHSLK